MVRLVVSFCCFSINVPINDFAGEIYNVLDNINEIFKASIELSSYAAVKINSLFV